MSVIDFALGASYSIVSLGAWTYVLRKCWARWHDERTPTRWRELLAVMPLWVVAVIWAASLVLALALDISQMGEQARQLVGGLMLASFGTAGFVRALNERSPAKAA